MNENKGRINFIYICLVAVFIALVAGTFNLQVTNGAEYSQKALQRTRATVVKKAPRGEIFDRNGKPLVTNKQGYSVILQQTICKNDEFNAKLLGIINVLEKYGYTYRDSLPISKYPYEYVFSDENSNGTTDDEKEEWFKERKKIKPDMPCDEAMKVYENFAFNISDTYTEDEKRKIVGIRYDLNMSGFSISKPFKIAEDIGLDAITELKERNNEFDGLLIVEEYYRKYEQSDIAAHIIGGIGKMSSEEYKALKNDGYSYNDYIGKRGAEKLFEGYLRGRDGTEISDYSGETPESPEMQENPLNKDAVAGNYILLTIDSDLQRTCEQSLARWVKNIEREGKAKDNQKGADANAGAAVVLDIKNGDVLACASYPTYNPETFSKDYKELSEDKNKPMWNRALNGTYTPGSTFKPLVALAALENNVVKTNDIITCEGVYKFYEDYQPKCWIWSTPKKTHGPINISQAIEYSCNYFFYEMGRRLGIDRISEFAKRFGLGEKTGIELGEESGNVSSKEYKKKIATNAYDAKWYAGDTIQTAIGQSYSYFTPIQLANYIATIANGGIRYKTHILKSVRSTVDGSIVYEPQPEILEKVEIKEENFNTVKQGMLGVVDEGSASAIFEDYKEKIGGKTGTAQIGKNMSDNALFVAFAPFNNPEIAVAVVIEHGVKGENAANVAKDIFDKYFEQNDISAENIGVMELIR